MPLFTTIGALSQTAASNAPDGSVDAPSTLDDQLRLLASFLAQIRDGKGFSTPVLLASAATTDIGAQNALAVEISGTTTITSFGTSYNGPRFLRFTGSLTLTHNASSLNLPTGANITTAAGDVCIAMPNQGATGWNVVNYQSAATAAPTNTFKNKIINGNFTINQRQVSGSSTAWGSGSLLMDRWKAGSGGCTMSFATSANVGTVTLTAGTLVQVVAGENLFSGSHVLSWTGTAQARVNGGAYSASPLVVTATGGADMTIEFNTGTVSKVQLEPGLAVTPFEQRLQAAEIALCQRYFNVVYLSVLAQASTSNTMTVSFPTMRATPSASLAPAFTSNVNSFTFSAAQANGGRGVLVATSGGVGEWTGTIALNAEL